MTEEQNMPVIHFNEETALLDAGDGIACLQFHSKSNSVSPAVRAFLREVLDKDLFGFDGMIIYNEGKNFSVGADLNAILELIDSGEYGIADQANAFQKMLMDMKYYHKPVVAAPFKNTLGGGLEVCMHCHRRVALKKSYMGLVEVGVGLIPTGGGVKEVALSVAELTGESRQDALAAAFNKLVVRTLSASAQNAREMGFLTEEDILVDTQEELFDRAKQVCLEMIPSFQPLTKHNAIPMGGKKDYDFLMAYAQALLLKDVLSPFDLEVAKRIARVMAGSDSETAPVLSEEDLLVLEAKGMWELKQEEGTRARIHCLLTTGTFLRN